MLESSCLHAHAPRGVIGPLDVQAAIDWAAFCGIVIGFIVDSDNCELRVELGRGFKPYFRYVNSFQMYMHVHQHPHSVHLRGGLCVS
jgi:hypothetical protein